MEKLALDLPAMYGDHHVSEVRRILLEMPGITEVYASSCFQIVEVTYDATQVDPAAINARLDLAGYLQGMGTPVETGLAASASGGQDLNLRHTMAYQQTGRVIGFGQNVATTGRALWPCPGMETVKTKESRDGEE